MDYDIPKILISDIDVFDNYKTIEVTLLLTPFEAENYTEIISKKIKTFENRSTTYGYIYKIKDIVDISYGKLVSGGNVRYHVKINAYIFDIYKGTVLIKCKLIKETERFSIYSYNNNISIVVEPANNEEYLDLLITDINITVDQPTYKIKYKDQIFKTVIASKVLTPVEDYNNWCKNPYGYNEQFKYIDYSGQEQIIDSNKLISISYNNQLTLKGTKFTEYGNFNRFKYIKIVSMDNDFKNINTDIPINKLKLTSFDNENLLKKLKIKKFEDKKLDYVKISFRELHKGKLKENYIVTFDDLNIETLTYVSTFFDQTYLINNNHNLIVIGLNYNKSAISDSIKNKKTFKSINGSIINDNVENFIKVNNELILNYQYYQIAKIIKYD